MTPLPFWCGYLFHGTPGQSNEVLREFDFVFLIQLKYIDGNDHLEKIIIQQHGLEEANATETEIRYILDNSEKKPLLIFDGYDEYR